MAARIPVLVFAVERLHSGTLNPKRSRLMIHQLEDVCEEHYAENHEDVVEAAASLPNEQVSDQNWRENERCQAPARVKVPSVFGDLGCILLDRWDEGLRGFEHRSTEEDLDEDNCPESGGRYEDFGREIHHAR